MNAERILVVHDEANDKQKNRTVNMALDKKNRR